MSDDELWLGQCDSRLRPVIVRAADLEEAEAKVDEVSADGYVYGRLEDHFPGEYDVYIVGG